MRHLIRCVPALLTIACTGNPVWIAQPLNEASFTPDDRVDLHIVFDLPFAESYSICDATPCPASGPAGAVRVELQVAVAGSPVPFSDLTTDALGNVRGDVTSYAEEGWNEVHASWRVLGSDPPPRFGGIRVAMASFFLEGPPADPPPSPLVGARLDEAGGTLAVPDGSVRLTAPQGALSEEVYLQIDLTELDLAGVVGPTVVLAPEDLALSAAATLNIRWNAAGVITDPAALRIARFAADGTWQEVPTSTADVATGIAGAAIDRLGRYTVIDCAEGATRDPKVLCISDLDQDGDGITGGAGDCNDNDALIHPGAPESCDGVDNDCDGLTDDADDVVSPADAAPWYLDADGDGAGDDPTGRAWCTPPDGAVRAGGDCDDADAARSPTATELCNDADDDCDGMIDDGVDYPAWFVDGDADGVGAGTATLECVQPAGTSALEGDCDDADPTRTPGAEDVCDGGIDNDCDPATTEVCP